MPSYQYLALIFSSTAIVVSVLSFLKTRRVNLYQDIDRLYLEVLKLGMGEPDFLDEEKTRVYEDSFSEDKDKLSKYNAYAFIVWNVCETIVDRMNERTFFMKDKGLIETWEPVVRTESARHRAWFDNEDNAAKFKTEFRTFIRTHYPPALPPGSKPPVEES